jgi:photosystem II stability/assembly factor-like uncharacterized protein
MARSFWLPLFLALTPSAPGAQTWERLGPAGGTVISLAAAPDGTVYLGTPDGHVFRSVTRGQPWELRGRVGGRLDGVVQQIVPDAVDRNRVLAAVWFRGSPGGGVFESSDGGQDWRLAGLAEETVRTLEQSPSAPTVWLAGTRSGVFRSADNARSWQRITPANDPELQNVDSVAVDPEDPETIYVGTYHLPWKTTDGGKTWNAIGAGMIDDSDIMSLRIDVHNRQRIFSSACSGIYRSEDAGLSWTKLQGIPYSSRRTQQIVQDPDDPRTLYAATTEGLWVTGDYGETWKRVTSREMNTYSVAVLPGPQGHVVLAGVAAEGVLRSEDGGHSFAAWNAGFLHRVLFALGADPADPGHLLARVEGSAAMLVETRDGGKSWAQLSAAAPRKTVARIFGSRQGWWVSFAEGGLARFDVSTGSWQESRFRELPPPASRMGSRSRSAGRAPGLSPQVTAVLEKGPDTIVSSHDGLWRKEPGGVEFRRLPAEGLPPSVTFLAPASLDALVAIAGNELWTSDAEGPAWKRVASPPGAGVLLWAVDRPSRGTLERWLGTQRGIFVCESGGQWRLLSNGLPPIASEPPAFNASAGLLAMSNGGLYESADGGSSWWRVDRDSEQGGVGMLIAESSRGFGVASYSEGLLLLRAGHADR